MFVNVNKIQDLRHSAMMRSAVFVSREMDHKAYGVKFHSPLKGDRAPTRDAPALGVFEAVWKTADNQYIFVSARIHE